VFSVEVSDKIRHLSGGLRARGATGEQENKGNKNAIH
jgi:hypothetical protein